MLSLLLAAALFQADPAAAQPPADPVANAPPAASQAGPTQPGAGADDSDTPKGAPVGDYDFVAWCHGALSGHMKLYEQVKPELVSIEQPGEVAEDEKNDKLRTQAGEEYLALYTRALNGVDHDKAGALMTRRKTAETQGSAIWDLVKDAPPRTRMWAWVGWDLPGRCETASRTMLTPHGRLAALHSPAPASDAGTAAPVQPQSIDDALGQPPPPPAAQTPVAQTPAADTPAAPADPSLRGPQ